MSERAKFMIRFAGAVYANELYDAQGREVFDLDTAKETVEELYPDTRYEIFNGHEGFSTLED